MTEPAPRILRRPSPKTLINLLQQRLDEKANIIRRLEDAELTLTALVEDLTSENMALLERLTESEAAADPPAD